MRLISLTHQTLHRLGMADESEDFNLRPHVPNFHRRISRPRHDEIEMRMQSNTINTAVMTVVIPCNLIGFQIPTLDGLVLSAREEVRMSATGNETSYGGIVTCQRQLELACGEIPHLDCPFLIACEENLICWIDTHGSHPSEQTCDHPHTLPWCMPRGLLYIRILG